MFMQKMRCKNKHCFSKEQKIRHLSKEKCVKSVFFNILNSQIVFFSSFYSLRNIPKHRVLRREFQESILPHTTFKKISLPCRKILAYLSHIRSNATIRNELLPKSSRHYIYSKSKCTLKTAIVPIPYYI